MATAELAVMGREGDTKLIWDRDNEAEVENARSTFKKLVKEKKFAAFSVKKGGDKGEQIRDFDADAEKIILVPPLQGG